jgi:hypothetical protein
MGEVFCRELKHEEGDGCCDIVFWKKIDDNPGNLTVLIQCKSGKNWSRGKAVEFNLWTTGLLSFNVNPTIAYAITDLLTKEQIKSQSKLKGLIFDRARIIKLLANFNSTEIQNIRTKIQELQLN